MRLQLCAIPTLNCRRCATTRRKFFRSTFAVYPFQFLVGGLQEASLCQPVPKLSKLPAEYRQSQPESQTLESSNRTRETRVFASEWPGLIRQPRTNVYRVPQFPSRYESPIIRHSPRWSISIRNGRYSYSYR